MEDETQDGSEVLETTETEAEAGETTETTDERDTRIAQLEKDKAELESKNKQLFERTKKAEGDRKAEAAPSQEFALSEKDRIYLVKADIHEDDLDEVLDRAKSKGISVKDAYAQVKPLLDARTEERRTASATHTKGGARGAAKATGADFLAKAEQTGDVPETEAGMQALQEARLARKKQK
jgi:hypothetical protein